MTDVKSDPCATSAVTLYEQRVPLNHGHDRCVVRAEVGDSDFVELVFEGRDPTTVVIRLTEPRDAHAIGQALIAASKNLELHR